MLSDEYPNKLKGVWELIPISDSLSPSTDFIPTYIDDTPDELDSTMDMLILQPSMNIEWLSDIRGASVTMKPSVIQNSLWSAAKLAYFDEDAYPDILICTPVPHK